jgi:hypothetical protein
MFSALGPTPSGPSRSRLLTLGFRVAHDQPEKNYPEQPYCYATQGSHHNPDDCLRSDVIPSDEQETPDTDDDGESLTGPQAIEDSARQKAS